MHSERDEQATVSGDWRAGVTSVLDAWERSRSLAQAARDELSRAEGDGHAASRAAAYAALAVFERMEAVDLLADLDPGACARLLGEVQDGG
jgi:hypothetical protein